MSDETRLVGYNKGRVQTRDIDELLGICRGLIADDEINANEIRFLARWLEGQSHIHNDWPTDLLIRQLAEILADGKIEPHELISFAETIRSIIGEKVIDGPGECHAVTSCELPYCNPQPQIAFEGQSFCFTGKFVFGTRDKCEKAVVRHGGIIKSGVVNDLDYLVIGFLSNPNWAHTSYGRKIEGAMALKSSGKKISILSEEHWVNSLHR